MNLTALGSRNLLVLAALASVTALAAGCGTASTSGSPNQAASTGTSHAGGSVTTKPPSPSPSPSSPASPSAPALAECVTSALKVKVGSSNGAAGTIFYSLDFTNVSGSTCFVQGYPGVSLVTAGSNSGSQVGADAKRDSVFAAKQVVLAPGKTAVAQLGIAEAGNFPSAKCQMVTAHWLKIFPPDQTVATYVPFTTQTCASTSVATMHIAALTAGA
jgi:hypothetical protein